MKTGIVVLEDIRKNVSAKELDFAVPFLLESEDGRQQQDAVTQHVTEQFAANALARRIVFVDKDQLLIQPYFDFPGDEILLHGNQDGVLDIHVVENLLRIVIGNPNMKIPLGDTQTASRIKIQP